MFSSGCIRNRSEAGNKSRSDEKTGKPHLTLSLVLNYTALKACLVSQQVRLDLDNKHFNNKEVYYSSCYTETVLVEPYFSRSGKNVKGKLNMQAESALSIMGFLCLTVQCEYVYNTDVFHV